MGSAVGRPGGLRRLFAGRKRWPAKQSRRAPPPGKMADPSIHQLDSSLLTRLENVYVEKSTTTVTQENPFASERSQKPSNLPQDRSAHSHDTFIIDKSSVGYLTSAQVIEILDKREEKKEEWTAAVVAEKFKIDPQDAENLMKFFSSFKQVPSKKPPSITLK